MKDQREKDFWDQNKDLVLSNKRQLRKSPHFDALDLDFKETSMHMEKQLVLS